MAADMAKSWDEDLHRSFTCAGRLVSVRLASLRDEAGAPQFEVRWLPGPPLRMLPADQACFDQGKRTAVQAIRGHLETLR